MASEKDLLNPDPGRKKMWEAAARDRPDLSHFFNAMAAAEMEGPLGETLVFAAFIEDRLGEMLRAYFLEGADSDELLGRGGLASFASRIRACAALGLISQRERDDSDRVRRIRNRFAHDPGARFEDSSIADLCNALASKVPDSTGKAAFTTGAVGLALGLTHREHRIARVGRAAES